MLRTWLSRLHHSVRIQQARTGRSRRLALRLELLEPRTVPSFLRPVSYSLGVQPTQPVIADFDNDGIPDLAVGLTRGAGAPGSVVMYQGDGQGGFTRATTYGVGTHPRALQAADLNGDGNMDLIVANWYDHTVSVLLGNGDGTFAAPMTFTVGISPYAQPYNVAVGDFNGDGIPDLAVTNDDFPQNTVSVLLGNGDGSFQDAVSYPTGFEPIGVAAGDLNHDGYDDIVVSNYGDQNVGVYLSNGDGTFQPAVNYVVGARAFGVALADLQGNGNLDIVTANIVGGLNAPNSVSVLPGNGDGTFAPRVDYLTGDKTPEFPVVGDFNGDGIPDIAVNLTTSDQVGVFLGDGQGGLGPMATFNASRNLMGIAAGDLNNDGFTDLVTTGSSRNTMEVLVNDGVWGTPAPRPPAGGAGIEIGQTDLFVTPLRWNTVNRPVNDSLWGTPAPSHDAGAVAARLRGALLYSTDHANRGSAADAGPRLITDRLGQAAIADLLPSVGALWFTPAALAPDRLQDPLA
jgi:hypothetical protein